MEKREVESGKTPHIFTAFELVERKHPELKDKIQTARAWVMSQVLPHFSYQEWLRVNHSHYYSSMDHWDMQEAKHQWFKSMIWYWKCKELGYTDEQISLMPETV